MKDRSDGSRNDSNPIDTRAADSTRGVKSDEQYGTPIVATRGARSHTHGGTPFDADAPRARQQDRRSPVNPRRQRTGHAADETSDVWMFRSQDDDPPRSGYGEQGFGAGDGGDGRWGGGRRGGYGGGRPGGDHGTRGGGWSSARQRHEMGRGPRSFGPDGWGPVDPAPQRNVAAPDPTLDREDAILEPTLERNVAAPEPEPDRKAAAPEPPLRDQPGDT